MDILDPVVYLWKKSKKGLSEKQLEGLIKKLKPPYRLWPMEELERRKKEKEKKEKNN